MLAWRTMVSHSVCLQLQQLGVRLHEAQWTARNSLGGFSISFFWPALERNQSSKKQQKMRRKMNKKSAAAKQVPTQCATIEKKSSDTDAVKDKPGSNTSPIVAHQPSDSTPVVVPSSPTSSKSQLSPVSPSSSPNLLKCLDVTYERREQGPGVSYKTKDGKEEWTPVVRKKRKARKRCESSESDSDGSKVDVSCSRLVRYEERDETPGLTVFRRGPATWIPIKAAKPKPIATRTRSKTLNI